MGHVSMPRTTHTLEMTQLADLNARLSEHRAVITAAEIGLEGAHPTDVEPGDGKRGGLPGSAVLVRLGWDGPPEFPYVHACFSAAGESAGKETIWLVDLHTAGLRTLDHRLGMRQQWGA